MSPENEHRANITRRELFGRAATGIGVPALAALLNRDAAAGTSATSGSGGLPGLPHFAGTAKRVIYLYMNGAPTHVDLFDYKPGLVKQHGNPVPENYLTGKRFSTMTGDPTGKLLLAPVEPFAQHGISGATVSSFMPHTAEVAD